MRIRGEYHGAVVIETSTGTMVAVSKQEETVSYFKIC